MLAVIILIAVLLVLGHLGGGAYHHYTHYQRHGVRPKLYYTYGRGWYGSARLPGGFRVGHRL